MKWSSWIAKRDGWNVIMCEPDFDRLFSFSESNVIQMHDRV